MTPFLRRWFDEAGKLGLPFWARWILILVAALIQVLVASAGVAAWDLIRRIHMDVEPSPPPVSDGGSAEDESRRAESPAQQDPNARTEWTDAG